MGNDKSVTQCLEHVGISAPLLVVIMLLILALLICIRSVCVFVIWGFIPGNSVHTEHRAHFAPNSPAARVAAMSKEAGHRGLQVAVGARQRVFEAPPASSDEPGSFFPSMPSFMSQKTVGEPPEQLYVRQIERLAQRLITTCQKFPKAGGLPYTPKSRFVAVVPYTFSVNQSPAS